MLKRRNIRRAKFICKRCGHKFELEVFEPGEAEEKRLSTSPVQCPECGGTVDKRS